MTFEIAQKKPVAEHTIAAGFAKALIDLAVSKGASRKTLMDRSQIHPEDLLDQNNRISLLRYMNLMHAGIELCDEPALALQFGEAFSMQELSIVGLISQTAETVADAFTQMNRYVRLMLDAGEANASDWFEFIRDNKGVWMALTSNIYNEHPQLVESAFARAVSRSTGAMGEQPLAKAVHFTFPEPGYSAEYDRIFKMPVVFGSDRNAFLVDESIMTIKLPQPNRYAFGVLSKHADELLNKLENSKTMKGQVESLLIPVLHTGDVSMEQAAIKLGLNRQVLYRKLKAEGVTYEKLLDELRCQMALHYLNGEKVSVNEAAYLTGFSDQSAFSRAFKRWTGISPSKIRSQNKAT